MAEDFDCKNWHVKSHGLHCPGTTFTADRGINAFKQVRRIPNNYWRGPINLVTLRKADMVSYRGWLASLNGSAEPFVICLCDPSTIKGDGLTQEEWFEALGLDISKLCGPINGVYGLPYEDGTCHADGTGFAIPGYSAAGAATGAVKGANTLTISGAAGLLRRGSYFSTSDHYLHIVTKDPVGNEVTFNPPLRRDIPAGEAIETEHPRVMVRLSSDESGRAVQNYGRWTDEVTLQVEEVLTR